MNEKLMFVIPIYIYDQEESDQREVLGINEDKPLNLKQTALHTTHIDSYWIDPDKNKDSGIRDIVFHINGNVFRTPYSQQIITEVIHPAMHVNAAPNYEQETFITGPN